MAKRATPALAGLSKMLKKAKPKQGTVSLPDGTYQGEIVSVVLGKTQKKKAQVDWTLKVLSGDCEGRTQHKYDLLATQENVDWVMGTLETLEVDPLPETDKAFAKALKDQVSKKVEFSVRASGDFANVYINELLEDADEGDEGDETGSESWEDEDRVEVTINDEGEIDEDGTTYAGALSEVDDEEETATVTFDDGDVLEDVAFDDLSVEEEEEE